ncbi:hypothetical protein NDU88_000815 [Pleurodeles waltl]|uniref:Uncharacterized protein n=1 Tax=Pleurodeles waltl TaxID=8319 RepID=A0AAV7KN07_PLEWA|nr:hypothetical protein NDU88_000815 [Pleurodeles waltl]
MTGNLRGGRVGKQAQLPRNNAAEREAAILDERHLGGAVKMAAPMEKGNSGAILSDKRLLAEGQKAEEGREREEVVIVISDEEQEGQESFGFVERSMAEQDVNILSRGAGADGLKESSLVRCSSIRSFEGNVSALNVLHVGEQVDLVDQEGVLVTGFVYGQVGRRVSRDKGKVLLDRWKPALQEVSAGCDAPRFPGRPGGLTVHQDAGRHAGGQSFPVKARAPLIHRKEGRVNSGAVYPKTRETVVRGSLGHGAGSVLGDEQPSTSWGAGASFKRLEETMLDYDDDEVDQDTRVAAPVLQSTVPEVVQGDHYGICRTLAGNLPRGELGMGMGRIVGGNYGREVCGFGGVDASVQVDGIKEDGAGKSEVTGDVREEDGSKVLQESVKAGGVVGAEVSERDVLVDSTSYGHKNRTAREKWSQGLIWTSRHAFMVFDGLRYMGVCVNDTNCRIVPVTGGQYYSALVGVGSIQLAGFSSGAAEGNAPVRTLMLLFPRRRDGMAAQDRVQCKIGITPMKRKCELEGKCWSGGHQCSLNSILTWCSSVVHFAV